MKKNNNLRNGIFFLVVIILLIFIGFYFKGITGNAIIANYPSTEYAPPFNLSNPDDLIFKISSDSLVAVNDQVNLTANVSIEGYIYQKGYVFNQRTHSWEVFNFDQKPVENSYWIKDFASKDLIIDVSNNVVNSSETYIVAYACQKIDKVWQCGCQSEGETNCKRWMLHKFDVTNITISPDIKCTVDANCSMTNGTCDTDRMVCVSGALCIPTCSCSANFAVGETCLSSNNCGLCNGTKQDGTLSFPFAIYNWTGLNNIRNNLGSNYVLMNSLNSSDLDYSGIGSNWQPLGNSTVPFRGSFNGKRFNVSDLNISRLSINYTGLFGYSTGNISNVALNLKYFMGRSYAGGLVGFSSGVVNNSYVVGGITSFLSSSYVGGLVGYSNGSILNSYATGNVVVGGSSPSNLGGLVGYSSGVVNASYSIGNISGGQQVGGLIGNSSGLISNSYATGDVSGSSNIGGLTGYAYSATISNSSATGSVTGAQQVGGLVGFQESAEISNSSATGSVTGTQQVGGLTGYAYSATISNSSATGNVTGLSSSSNIGGLTGYAYITKISNSFATGNITVATGSSNVGGLSGYHYLETISNSFATGNVNGGYSMGGLVGVELLGIINNSYATGSVTGSQQLGGLVGQNKGKINTSYATGNVSGVAHIGGLAGDNDNAGIYNSYATGSADGVQQVGGLVGYSNIPTISNSYSIGKVTGSLADVGGLVGYSYKGTNSYLYWDNETSQKSNSIVGVGKNTTQMKTPNTFSTWDSVNIWNLTSGNYPRLRWQTL